MTRDRLEEIHIAQSPNAKLHRSFDDYMKGSGLSLGTRRSYRYTIRRLLEFAGGRDIDINLLESFRDEVVPTVDQNTWKGYAHAINKYASYLGKDFRLSIPKTIKREAESLRQDEFERLLEAAYNQRNSFIARRDLAILLLLGDGAARAGEIRKMLVKDLDLAKGHVLVRRPKGRHDRRIYFGQETREAIQLYLQSRKLVLADRDEQSLFLSQKGHPFTGANTVLRIVHRTSERAHLERRPHPHMFRHMRITELSQQLNPFQLQRFAGHADISTTMTYVHIDEEEILEIIRGENHQRVAQPDPRADLAEAKRALANRLAAGKLDADTFNRALKDLTQ